MKNIYFLRDGTEVTKDQIEDAFNAGRAVLCYGRGEGKTSTSLMLDGQHYDTRGQCFSIWDEAWTQKPEDINECWSAVGAKIGRPTEMAGGKKVNTYLDSGSVAIAARLGNGNVSDGIRKALAACAETPKVMFLLTTGSGQDGDEWNVESIHLTASGAERAREKYQSPKTRPDSSVYSLPATVEEWPVED